MKAVDVLLLNANYEPLNVCDVRRAYSLVMMGKADILHDSPQTVKTSEGRLPAPSVVRMKYLVRRPLPLLRLSRHSILARDGYTCQYCGSTRDLTIDHVIPRWMGGPQTWENLVTCCRRCNLKKADKTLKQVNMKLRTTPHRPKFIPYISLPQYLRAVQKEEWNPYLPLFEDFLETWAEARN